MVKGPCGYSWCSRQVDPDDRATVLGRPPGAAEDDPPVAFCCPHHVPASWEIIPRDR